MTDFGEVEALLRTALVPIEPSAGLADRLERGLTEITDLAADELAEWELATMRDPRNWARPVAAAVVGGAAAGALVLVRARQGHKRREAGPVRSLEKSMRQVAGDLSRRLDR